MVTDADGGEQTLEADAVLVATGAAPRTLPTAQPDGERILTWEQVYDLTEVPDQLIVVGSGRDRRGVRQRLPRPRRRRSPWSPAATGCCPARTPTPPRVLEDVLTRRGMNVLSRSRMESVTRDGDTVTVTLTDGRTVEGSHCILALGSVPNTAGLGLEEAGVATDDGGFVNVDRVSRTSARGVYAAGDCTGVLMLACVAAMQGRIAMWHFLGDAVSPAGPQEGLLQRLHRPRDRHRRLVAARPSTRARSQAEAVTLPLAGNARAKMQGVHDGFVKLFCRPGTGIVVGGVVVAPAGQRADPPGLDRGRRVADRRPAGPGVHRLPVDERLGRRGRPQVASRLTSWSPGRSPRRLTRHGSHSRPRGDHHDDHASYDRRDRARRRARHRDGARRGRPGARVRGLAAPGLTIPNRATITVDGRGYGHGHGLSQYGAAGRGAGRG